jgi:glyoxylase-like metal-dependent hydrolase (beta-lactamase superfamily II)
MKIAENITYLAAIQGDTRIRTFRRTFPDMEGFAGMYVDAYAIISERYVVICDTLLCPDDMQVVMENVRPELATGRQLLVINSHADWDHAWGNSYFTGRQNAPLLAHRHCRERLQSAEAQAELAVYQKHNTTFRNVALTAPTLTFTHDLTLYGGDLTLTLFPAPGHTADSCALWIPELRLLLAFDSIEAPFPVLESAAGVQPLMTTLHRFLALEPLHVLCSHSAADSALVHKNLDYIQTLVRRTLQLTHRPTDAEMVYGSALIGSPFAEFGEGDETGTSAFYRQAHEENIRFIIKAEIPKENPSYRGSAT